MADEFKKLADDLKKGAEEWVNYVDKQSDKVVDFIRTNTKELTEAVKKEQKKMELRSQIGEHTRALNKAYTRLGEAYYASASEHKAMTDVSDVMALIQSNRKLVDLLKEQLKRLEGK